LALMCPSIFFLLVFFFFSSRRRHTRSYGDWSSDVCSSDLSRRLRNLIFKKGRISKMRFRDRLLFSTDALGKLAAIPVVAQTVNRSEERRVGKEGRSRWSPYHYKINE